MSVFSVFYNADVEIGEIKGGRRYDDDGITFQKIGAFRADFQPYNGGLAEKEYGLSEEVTARIYTDEANGILKTGRVAAIDDIRYDILYVETWEMGDVALLRQREKPI